MTPKAAILFKIVHTCARECLILKYKYVQNPWQNAVGDDWLRELSKTRAKIGHEYAYMVIFCERFLHTLNKKKIMRFLFLAYAEFYDPFITKILINIAYQD